MFHGKVILVVDDEADLREILCDELSFEGAEVFEASNGHEALKIIRERHFDAILSDLRMPGGDGVALAKEVRALNASQPVVMLITGFADLRSDEAYALGADGYVTKPFHLQELKDNLLRLLTPPAVRWGVESKKTAKDLHLQLTLKESLQTKKVGRGGLFVSTDPQGLRVGDLVVVHFKDNHRVHGIVRWTRPDTAPDLKMGLGLEFVFLSPEELRFFSEIEPQWEKQKSFIPFK